MQQLLAKRPIFIFMICSNLLLLPFFTFAKTTVTNTISVSADGAGESHAAVTTEVNGETIEDWSETSSSTISYSNTYTVGEVSSHTEVSTDQALDTETRRALLETLIARLQALIQLYVTLNHQ